MGKFYRALTGKGVGGILYKSLLHSLYGKPIEKHYF